MPNPEFSLVAGKLCLDFANTDEKLASYADLVAFALQTGVASAVEATMLLAAAARRPAEAARVLARARAIREAVLRLFGHRPPESRDLELLANERAALSACQRLRRSGDRFEWVCEPPPGDLAWPLSSIVTSATELLTDGDLDRVRSCESDTCGWLFYDGSKNHSRRWCDMGDCGNRAKARSFYQRRKKAKAPI